MERRFHTILLISLCSTFIKPSSVYSQEMPDHDSSYYTTYHSIIIPRIYLSQKYAVFVLPSSSDQKYLRYSRNSKLNMGIGATYNNFSFNVAYGFPFLNPDYKKNQTTSIDLQLHMYPRKWTIDVLGIYHKGFYPKGSDFDNLNTDYYRPDAKIKFFGLAAYHVVNGERFSYRAAMTQNEWQKKSAGSLLFGGEAHYGIMKADSAIVPKLVQNRFPQAGIDKINFFSIGPGIGYAYTLVIKKHFFVTASLTANLNLNFASEEKINDKDNRVAVNPCAIYKAAIGYNSNAWAISATCAGNALQTQGISSSEKYSLATGCYRLVVAKKIQLRKH